MNLNIFQNFDYKNVKLCNIFYFFIIWGCGPQNNEPGSCSDVDGDGKNTVKDCFVKSGDTATSTSTSTEKGLYTFGQDLGKNKFNSNNGRWKDCPFLMKFEDWGIASDGLIYGQPDKNSAPTFPKTINEACARAAFQNAANDKYALSIIGAMDGIKKKAPLRLLFDKGTDLARTLDKTIIYLPGAGYGPNPVSFLSGQKYALLYSSSPTDKDFYQIQCSPDDNLILGFQAENFRYLFPHQLSSAESLAIIEFIAPSKATYSCLASFNKFSSVSSFWKSGDGDLFIVKNLNVKGLTYYGKNALINADGTVCYDSLNDTATESWIRAAGSGIKCE